jgi:hypothetical protein
VRTEADLRSAAAAAGLTVAGAELVPMPGDPSRSVVASRMVFDDPWAAARFLVAEAKEDATDPIVRAWSLAMLARTRRERGERGSQVSRELAQAFARTIHGNVQDAIAFVHEPKETFQSARVTMMAGAGDCDDHARLVYALARAGGLPATMTFLEEDEQPVHVVAKIGGAWAETTIPAEFGEAPLAAYARLSSEGVPLAADPFKADAARELGELAFVTPGDVLAFRQTWNPYVVGVANASIACADELDAKSAGAGDDRRVDAGSIMTLWNLYSGWSDVEIVEAAGDILKSFQQTVLKVGQVYAPAIHASCPDVALPAPPSTDVQAQVIGRVEGLGILAHGVLQILGMGAGGALATLGAAAAIATSTTTADTVKVVAIAAAVLGVAYVAWQGLSLVPRKRNPRRRRRR